ncbi:transporter [Acinetobacter nectaris]|uniref:transporter n=1 Tax=Acinetobacter nectaris TaxID=1219382 RepID=UPI001F1E312B|nr:transporter [Acinetobacter nectaris]
MKKFLKITMLTSITVASTGAFAEDFSFDRPGTGFGTSTAPVGHVAWEQGLPTVQYSKANINNDQQQRVSLQEDMLLRTGLTKDLELQLGWDGPSWLRTTQNGKRTNISGLGDMNVGLKKAIDLQDNRMSMALLGQVTIATGNYDFSNHDNIYAIASSVQYAQNDLLTTGITMRYEMQNSDWAVTAVPTLSYKLSNKWSGYSEFVYRKQESEHIQTSLATGVMYALNNRMQLDASIGAGLSGDVPDYKGGFGVSFLF